MFFSSLLFPVLSDCVSGPKTSIQYRSHLPPKCIWSHTQHNCFVMLFVWQFRIIRNKCISVRFWGLTISDMWGGLEQGTSILKDTLAFQCCTSVLFRRSLDVSTSQVIVRPFRLDLYAVRCPQFRSTAAAYRAATTLCCLAKRVLSTRPTLCRPLPGCVCVCEGLCACRNIAIPPAHRSSNRACAIVCLSRFFTIISQPR